MTGKIPELSAIEEDEVRIMTILELLEEKKIITKKEYNTKFDLLMIDFKNFKFTQSEEIDSK